MLDCIQKEKQFYYRVSDLALIYETFVDNETGDITMFEYINGFVPATFDSSEFYISQC